MKIQCIGKFMARQLRALFGQLLVLLLVPLAIYSITTGVLVIFQQGGIAQAASVNANFNLLAESLKSCSPDMVPVGDICIDRHEASVWSSLDGGEQYRPGLPAMFIAPFHAGCQANGYGCTFFARSVPNVVPAYNISWYQAAVACANSGKRLPTSAEWQTAALGTNVSPMTCNTSGTQLQVTPSDDATGCRSQWGALRMPGNVAEWTADWEGVVGNNGAPTLMATGFGEDAYIHGGPISGSNPPRGSGGSLRPFSQGQYDEVDLGYAASLRGGSYREGTGAGIFALRLDVGPAATVIPLAVVTQRAGTIGFRCARNR